MALPSGIHLGAYEVLAPLGAGGMGEVYRARDTRLGREVALKVLREDFAGDPQRLARFEREARLLASLSHPCIAGILEIEPSDSGPVLVLELVEGPTLDDRLRGGGLPMREAVSVCRQIAEALEAAHAKGIIHRDLKPSNVKLTAEGRVKLLDFGLARALAPEAMASGVSQLRTDTQATHGGVIVGTAPYMSPEQARGEALDKRTDVWSFGCVLYETLTGRRAFSGATTPDVLAAVLEREPDWHALPAGMPGLLRSLLRRCLQKDKAQRLHDIADARIEIEEALKEELQSAPVQLAERAPTAWRASSVGAGLAVGLLLGAATMWALRALSPPDGGAPLPGARLAIPLPAFDVLDRDNLPVVAISPDGTRIVYAAERASVRRLYLRRVDEDGATPIPGTEGAFEPFFSPDGGSLAFFAGAKLKKLALAGDAPVVLADAPTPRGGSWGIDDTILFVPRHDAAGVWRVPASGGTPERLTAPEQGEVHRWPELLPSANAFLFTSRRGGRDQLAVERLDTGERRSLIEGTSGRYAPSGHLVFARAGALMAAPFDVRRLRLTGDALPVQQGLASSDNGAAHFSFSRNGALVYLQPAAEKREAVLLWVDRKGSTQLVSDARRAFQDPRLSPDGRCLAVTILEGTGASVWVHDLERGTFNRLTLEDGWSGVPRWTPDGSRLTFTSDRNKLSRILFWQVADGSQAAEILLPNKPPFWDFAGSWSPDGRVLAFIEADPNTNWDIWTLPVGGTPSAFLKTPFTEMGPAFSPDGGWLAYESDESGRNEVYVRPYPGPGAKFQVSTEGGTEPVWARGGRELFYRNDRKLIAVEVSLGQQFRAGKPRTLFERRFPRHFHRPVYDVAPDGARFVTIQSEEEPAPERLNVVLGWFEELKSKVGSAGQ